MVQRVAARRPARRVTVAACAALMLLTGCRSREERAAKFAAMYESAMADNNPFMARLAMQKAVAYDDANPDYWQQLGSVQLALGDYSGAFNAYLRANELDHSNPAVLQALADLAVIGGHSEDAQRYARQVLLLRPDDPAPQTTLGFVALRNRDYDGALKRAETVLASRVDDSNATILKARALAGQGKAEPALTLLRDFVAGHPRDASALDALGDLSGRFGNLPGQKDAQSRELELRPKDVGLRVNYARTLYRLGERDAAHDMLLPMMRSGEHGGLLIDMLALFLRYEPRDRALAEVRALAPQASAGDKMRYAYFLMMAGQAAEGEALVAPLVSLPVTAANAAPLALLAQAQAMQGRNDDALKLLDAVLAFDDGNITALRARTDLYLRTGRGRQAVFDAQRLVASKPRSADDRVRLARAYTLAGQPQLAENTYRAGIQEIGGADPLLFAGLRNFLVKAGRNDELAAVQKQFVEQTQLARAQW
ncbi:putative Zn-dependent protease [Sphingomonas sp. BE138]|uniref:tetratricopeptide repeat protein n=1 Tax=Sphingomonas sp. BE138 TaxID=2817845 RepID=UPI002865DBEA|nr:tetratricopeptide repeat protein [Sphingomonas sp. BE138]MDR6788453.1 putative Zn-dependent protease [Sphingomonas sp. BE138]